MTQVYVYKGSECENYNLDLTTTLSSVRQVLSRDRYMTTAHRFIYYQSTSLFYQDVIIGNRNEQYIPLADVIGPANQLVITDITNPMCDLVGIGVNWFSDRHMVTKVKLNTRDTEAITTNSGKFEPYMLTNVKATNPQSRMGMYDQIVICEKGSVVEFVIGSWGAAGFGYSIKTSRTTIVEDLYITFRSGPSYGKAKIRRYEGNAATIVIEGTDTLRLSDASGAHATNIDYQTCKVRTWRVISYRRDGETFSCNNTAPSLTASTRAADGIDNLSSMIGAAALQSVIPEGTISPAGPAGGHTSQQTFYRLSDIREDDRSTQPLGEVTFYFFVFESHEVAQRVIERLNTPSDRWVKV